jgi:hypothetical protein
MGQSSEQQRMSENIRAAWEERSQRLKSFHCSCALTRIDMISLNGTGDLFDDAKPGPKGPVELNSTFTVMMQGAKMAMHSKSEEWNTESRSKINLTYSVSFNCVTNKAMIIGEVLSYPTAHSNNEPKPSDALTKNRRYTPLWLSFTPSEMLTRLGFDVSRMSVSDARAIHKGIQCIEVAIPRGPLKGHVYIDPSRGYLPVRFVEWRAAGKMRSEIEIEYEKNDVLGWVISGWLSTLYDGDQQLQTSLSGSVESITVNEPISDHQFDIAYPVDTRIRETLDGTTKYFIQEANGLRRETGGTKR